MKKINPDNSDEIKMNLMLTFDVKDFIANHPQFFDTIISSACAGLKQSILNDVKVKVKDE